MTFSRDRYQALPSFAMILLIVILTAKLCNAEISCESDFYCQQILKRDESLCVDGKCSNPFQQGCLKTAGLSAPVKGRICNSDDENTNEQEETSSSSTCFTSPHKDLHYPEIRIHHGNWETCIFQAWIYQIIFMEIMGLPATVGRVTSETKAASFYSLRNTLEFSAETYPYEALKTANDVEDCAKTEDPCVHVLPEVWEGQQLELDSLVADESIIRPATNGQVGTQGFHIPAFTAREFPSLGFFYGLQGESRRQFLADTFRRPTTWLEYCEEVSESRCNKADDTATRFPTTEDEEELYFSEGEYTGYFRFTNNTGYVVTYPCSWSHNTEGVLFWNNIVGLKMDGPEKPAGGYSVRAITQIWRAANATKSHVFLRWYEPDRLIEEFRGTDAEFQPLLFPAATQECAENRPTTAMKCGNDTVARRGPKIASCEYDPSSTVKVVSKFVGDYNFHVEESFQSPAMDVITAIRLSKKEINQMLKNWLNIGSDRSGNDAREAVCGWVVDNFDKIMGFIPPGYPKQIVDRTDHYAWYLILAGILAVFAIVVTILAMALVYRYRDTKVMAFAQPFFVRVVLFGHLLTSFAAFTVAFPPTTARCISYVWLFVIGYTVELVPVLIKISAFNKLIKSSHKKQRINISKRKMMKKVSGLVLFAVVFLICWTVLDPYTASSSVEVNENDPTILDLDEECSSNNDLWLILTFCWQALLLLICAVLAFQSRNVMKEINEAKSVGFVVYSHFFFMMMRGIFLYFDSINVLYSGVINALFSFNSSLDVLLAIVIYILPKITKARKDPKKYRPSAFNSSLRKASVTGTSSVTERLDTADRTLKILVCTANLGNTKPTRKSMEAWIPPEGSCVAVSPLEGVDELQSGNFDLIVIGMQEATWKSKDEGGEESTIRGDVISEAEILTALEEHHTAAIRQRTHDILGEHYCQVGEDCRGQMKLSIWALDNLVDEIKNIKISGANTGIGNVLANKGGIVISLDYRKTRISFVSAHLAAHEGENYYRNRCDDVRAILRESKTYELSKKLDVAVSSHHIFFMGDLNFRTKFGKEDWTHEDNVKYALELVAANDFETLYSFDELWKGVSDGDLLVGFKTLPCHFPPTFKVEREPGLVYREQRTPSYTDRVLFKSADGLDSNLKALAYEPCIDFITSDHKPVRAAFSVVPNDTNGATPGGRNVRLAFKELECWGLPAGDSDGMSDPYLTFLWDGIDLAQENKFIRHKLKRLWRHGWPSTRYISKDLNPKWEGDEITLVATDAVFGKDAMLYILVMDYDAFSQDDFLCVLPLNLEDLVSSMGSQVSKTIPIDRPLLRDGRRSGGIKFQLHISVTSPEPSMREILSAHD